MAEKEACYPPDIKVTEATMEVGLQNLLDHTTKRLLELQKDALRNLRESKPQLPHSLVLISKYGFDGSGSHPKFSMKIDDPEHVTESQMFAAFVYPIMLMVKKCKDSSLAKPCTIL